MNTITLRVLVLDTNSGNVTFRLHQCLKPFAARRDHFPNTPPWDLSLHDGRQVRVECDFHASVEDARSVLSDQQLNLYNLILLDLNWNGQQGFGIELLSELHQQQSRHPLLVLYTDPAPAEYVALAMSYGARATKIQDNTPILSILLQAVGVGSSQSNDIRYNSAETVLHDMDGRFRHINRLATDLKNLQQNSPGFSQQVDELCKLAEEAHNFTALYRDLVRFRVSDRGLRSLDLSLTMTALHEKIDRLVSSDWEILRLNSETNPERSRPECNCPNEFSVTRLDTAEDLLVFVIRELCKNLIKHSGGEDRFEFIKMNDHLALRVSNRHHTSDGQKRFGIGLTGVMCITELYGLAPPDVSESDSNRFVIKVPVARLTVATPAEATSS